MADITQKDTYILKSLNKEVPQYYGHIPYKFLPIPFWENYFLVNKHLPSISQRGNIFSGLNPTIWFAFALTVFALVYFFLLIKYAKSIMSIRS